jgi:hypothetical protein
MDVTDSGIVTFVNLLPENAYEPIELMFVGPSNVIFCKDDDDEAKANDSIILSDAGNTTSLSKFALLKE